MSSWRDRVSVRRVDGVRQYRLGCTNAAYFYAWADEYSVRLSFSEDGLETSWGEAGARQSSYLDHEALQDLREFLTFMESRIGVEDSTNPEWQPLAA